MSNNQDVSYTIPFEIFFDKFLNTVNAEDRKILENLPGGNLRDWEQDGKNSVEMRNLIKKYFGANIKSGYIPWHVPQCAGGIIFIVASDNKSDLTNIIKTLGIEEEEFTFHQDTESANKYIQEYLTMAYT